MPGTTNPTLATQLFHEQSGRWERIARAHIQNVRNLSLKFLRRVFEHLTTEDITDNLLAYKVIPAYNARVGAATAELEKILRDKDHEAVPYSHYLKNKAERNIDKKARDRLHKFLLHERESFRAQGQYLTPGAIDGALQTFEPRGDGVAGPALDTMLVYYNSYLKTFIDPVAMHVIERHLIQGLHNILSEPRSIAELDDREIAKLAKEPAYITERRADLQQTKQLLEDALNKYEAITI